MRKPNYAPLEARWCQLEDALPRQGVLCFHSFLRDNEISAGRRFSLRERLGALKAWMIRHPATVPTIRRHYPEVGHTAVLAVSMPTDTDQVSLSCCSEATNVHRCT